MRRRAYLASGFAVASLAGCVSGDTDDHVPTGPDDSEPDPDPGGNSDGTDTPDGPTVEERSKGFVPASTVHQWPFLARDGDSIEDVIGDAHGTAHGDLTTIEGTPWRGGYAEYATRGGGGHIDLGHLDDVNRAINERSLTILATVAPSHIEPGTSMTIFGAGGGSTNWLEFRLGNSPGDYPGHPMLFVRDDRGNTAAVVSDRSVEAGRRARVAVQLAGDRPEDIAFWVNGIRTGRTVIRDDTLTGQVDPEQTYGIFASNPQGNGGSIGTRRWFPGTIDNVVVCNEVIGLVDIVYDFLYRTDR